MNDIEEKPLTHAQRWSDAWMNAYRWRANGYGSQMPKREHRKMMKAGRRMDEAEARHRKENT